MTDLELLKLSADAAGVDVEPYTWNDGTGYDHEGYRLVGTVEDEWNPLEDSEQALNILTRLSLDINYRLVGAHPHVVVSDGLVSASCRVERWDESDAKGVRRAIVEAAAATCEPPEVCERAKPHVVCLQGLTGPEQPDCLMCSHVRLMYGVVACGSTLKCVGANQFKGRLTRVQLWKE